MTAHTRLNALVQTLDQRAATLDTMIALGGGLCMDNPAYAQDLKLHSKGVVTHRRYLAHDDELYIRWTPDAWLNVVASDGANGVLIQAGNEPVIDGANVTAFVSWNVRVLALARARGVSLAVGAFSVGNPRETLIASGAFDKLLLALTDKDALILHEYFINHPADPAEKGYLCGRVEWWLERMQFLHSACKTVVIGEYGRDLGGGQNDGWRGQGWSIEDFSSRCMDGIEHIYQPLSERYDVNIFVETFCAGHGFGNRWQSWNVEGEAVLTNTYRTWNDGHPIVTIPSYPTGTNPAKKLVNHTDGLKLRSLPSLSGTQIRVMAYQELVTVYAQPIVSADSYDWQRVIDSKNNAGWSANHVDGTDSFVDVPPPAETWTVDLAVPFVSQIDGASSASNNDCGVSSLLMQERFYFASHGLLTPTVPSVDDLVPYTPLALPNPPHGLTFTDIIFLARQTGFTALYQSGLIADKLTALLDAGKPVMALVDYSLFNPVSGSSISHLCIVKGYSASYFNCHDPYKLGANYRILKSQLDAAMKAVPQNSGSYQGLVIA